MSIKVVVPQIGQSIAEAIIVKWFKQPGERVEKGETLVEIGTDKINTEIPAPASGIVQKLLAAEGETVPVESEIAIINGSESAGETPAVERGGAGEAPAVEVSDRSERLSPLVRRLAREHNIDLATIKGTGTGGRITKDDVQKLVNAGGTPTVQRFPMSRMRKLIAAHMLKSKHTTAELTTFFEIDMNAVEIERRKAKLTYLPFVMHAVAQTLREFSILNSSIDGEEIILKREINLGIAVAMEEGLIAPVIKHADEKSILDLARAAQDLSERARSKRLTTEDLEGGTFTITNPGVFGALMGTPIINQPQVAILGIGAVVKRPVVIDDTIAIRPMAYFSLTYDHRAMDGETADGFLAHVKNILEKQCPSALE